ncbi:unnamed protein product [Bursaphelenchus xylophilus]|uniref:glutathione transferase n=1 Tax=Bursaphelenchus xylophilus TaxID=6326 RepID=A0A1I7RZW6_BURXY|nr:unnamed protein product [Bursaphelenchus xylophilus]CAG9109180.1 unnamed protein product [Bursaphelenchus xylophilus]
MVQYKLTYFDARGLAEPARLILNYAGVKFEDERIAPGPENLNPIRDQLPFGQVPVLTIDGKTKIAQSLAIFRFLGRRHGLGGKDEVEQAVIDSYGEFIYDLLANGRAYTGVASGRTQGDKEKLQKEFQTFIDTKWEKYFNKLVEASGSGFLHKSGVTWPDFIITNIYESATTYKLDPVLKMKNFKAIHDKVKALPQLKTYFAQRKQTAN